jgi:hypothetical protein
MSAKGALDPYPSLKIAIRWFKRAAYVYFAGWILFISAAMLLHPRLIGTPDFAPYAWRIIKKTAAWPYVPVIVIEDQLKFSFRGHERDSVASRSAEASSG